MAITVSIKKVWTRGSESITETMSYAFDGVIDSDPVVAPAGTNVPNSIAFVKANLKSVYIVSDQAVTLKTNSTGTPQETINLAAGVPLEWQHDCGLTAPFAGDVTEFFWSNAGGVAANIKIRISYDSTP